jgi:uncharacterized protein YegJ (DUF2314 family)
MFSLMKGRHFLLYFFCAVYSSCSSPSSSRPGDKDSSVWIADDDYRYQGVVFRARDSIPFLCKHYTTLADSTNWYQVYSTFRQFGKSETMWLDVIDFDGKQFTGILVNHPTTVHNVKYGDTLKIDKYNLDDWVIYSGDAVLYGDFIERYYYDRKKR